MLPTTAQNWHSDGRQEIADIAACATVYDDSHVIGGGISNPTVVSSNLTGCAYYRQALTSHRAWRDSCRAALGAARTRGFYPSPSSLLRQLHGGSHRSEREQLHWLTGVPALGGCIYLLLKTGRVVYVGETVNLLVRLGKHQEAGKLFDAVRFVYLPDAQSRLYVEAKLIARLRPQLNNLIICRCGRRITGERKHRRGSTCEECASVRLKRRPTGCAAASQLAKAASDARPWLLSSPTSSEPPSSISVRRGFDAAGKGEG